MVTRRPGSGTICLSLVRLKQSGLGVREETREGGHDMAGSKIRNRNMGNEVAGGDRRRKSKASRGKISAR